MPLTVTPERETRHTRRSAALCATRLRLLAGMTARVATVFALDWGDKSRNKSRRCDVPAVWGPLGFSAREEVRAMAWTADHVQQIEASPEDIGLSSAGMARLQRHVQAYVDTGKFPGALSMVQRRGKVVHVLPMMFRVAPCAKMALQLVSRVSPGLQA